MPSFIFSNYSFSGEDCISEEKFDGREGWWFAYKYGDCGVCRIMNFGAD
jgi:hypothetical protein